MLNMVQRMITDQVDDGRTCTPGVVQIGNPVPQPGTQVQQRCGRHARHPTIAVCCAGADPFKQ